MRRGHLLVGLTLLFSCSSPNVERQSVADGHWRIKCKFSFEQCVKEVERVCPDPSYYVTRGSSLRRTYGVDPGKTVVWTSELNVICGRSAVEEAEAKLLAGDAGAGDAAPAPPRAMCTPGVTQSCLGPGACAGAQACRNDGAGFGPCDCGSATKTSVADAGIADVVAGP